MTYPTSMPQQHSPGVHSSKQGLGKRPDPSDRGPHRTDRTESPTYLLRRVSLMPAQLHIDPNHRPVNINAIVANAPVRLTVAFG